MTRERVAVDVLRVREQLKSWAERTGEASARQVVNDLAELYAAAKEVTASVDALIEQKNALGAKSGRELIGLQTWLYDELLDHAEALRRPLQTLVDRLYGDQAETVPRH